jgi:hypothetical protein
MGVFVNIHTSGYPLAVSRVTWLAETDAENAGFFAEIPLIPLPQRQLDWRVW